MATVNEKMTALADEIRELSGTTTTKSIDAMTSDVNAVNTEVSSQADLIAQISNALEGKAGGSGGTSVETCTVNITHYPSYSTAYAIKNIWYQSLDNEGNIVLKELSYSSGTIDYAINNFAITNVICPSMLYISAAARGVLSGNVSQIIGNSNLTHYIFQINGESSIEFQPVG